FPEGNMRRFKGHKGKVFSLAFSPDGSTLASGSADHTIKFWEPATTRELASFPAHEASSVLDMAFSPDGRLLASGGVGYIHLREMPGGRPATYLSGEMHLVWKSLAFSPDSALLATGDIGWGESGEATLWEVTRGRAVARRHEAKVWDVAFAPDGKTLAV